MDDDTDWSRPTAYHSTRKAPFPIYHLFNDCYGGSQIHDHYRREGTGDRSLCRDCAAMARRVEVPTG